MERLNRKQKGTVCDSSPFSFLILAFGQEVDEQQFGREVSSGKEEKQPSNRGLRNLHTE